MSFLIVRPEKAPPAYKIAAEIFADLTKEVTGVRPGIVTDRAARSALPGEATLTFALIGSDDVNLLTRDLLAEAKMPSLPLRYGTDDYAVQSGSVQNCPSLVLAGGRGRSTIYAVYRYFEKILGCQWFWDGDRIPKKDKLPLQNISFSESPRFQYRGTRYFAHRGLHRFQAEHWSAEDWKKEIDWLLKKRLNLFLLRIGTDDLFQKAFPGVVDYPDPKTKLPEAGDGFDDRTLFWDLRFRGELRKQILSYAKDRDLMHPEDCGTMTHWYSRTPKQFLEKMRPALLSQPAGTNYADTTGLAWDIREEEMLDLYFRLTDTHIREYGSPELFHTIGLAERAFSDDREANLRLKLLVYRLISRRLREKYPHAPLLVASWDLWMFYTPDEVKTLLSSLDPEQAILLDYTSDTVRENNFTAWGVRDNFPWVFGIFHAYEPSNEIRGNYPLLCSRMEQIRDDKSCKGMVFWPETSHGDPLMTEFFASSAWELPENGIDGFLPTFCEARYPVELQSTFLSLWKTVLPLASLNSWSKFEKVTPCVETDVFCRAAYLQSYDGTTNAEYDGYIDTVKKHLPSVSEALQQLAPLVKSADFAVRRDTFDLARTFLSRVLNACCLASEQKFVQNDRLSFDALTAQTEALCELFARLLESHADYSLADTFAKLQNTAPVNPCFPETLKKNCDNLYCRSHTAECVRSLYLPELRRLFALVKESFGKGALQKEPLFAFCEENRSRFEKTPLVQFTPRPDPDKTLLKAADLIGKLKF